VRRAQAIGPTSSRYSCGSWERTSSNSPGVTASRTRGQDGGGPGPGLVRTDVPPFGDPTHELVHPERLRLFAPGTQVVLEPGRELRGEVLGLTAADAVGEGPEVACSIRSAVSSGSPARSAVVRVNVA
jgi:hypothetical protein